MKVLGLDDKGRRKHFKRSMEAWYADNGYPFQKGGILLELWESVRLAAADGRELRVGTLIVTIHYAYNKYSVLENCAAAKARDPPRALTAATTAPSPAQASGRALWPARRASQAALGAVGRMRDDDPSRQSEGATNLAFYDN